MNNCALLKLDNKLLLLALSSRHVATIFSLESESEAFLCPESEALLQKYVHTPPPSLAEQKLSIFPYLECNWYAAAVGTVN